MGSIIKVSVIVPVYNSEKYIERCLKSLFEQTLDSIEYIFVDDHSTDNSVEILKSVLHCYPDRVSQARILRNEKNMGVGYSRQKGVDVANGIYIVHCDSDDWIEPPMYEKMYNLGVESNADIVGCDYMEEFSGHSEYRKQDFTLKGKEICKGILEGEFHSGLWSRLIKREFLREQKACFMEGLNFMEDTLYLFPLHLKSKKTVYIPEALYHYRQVEGGLTHSLNKRQLEYSLLVVKKIGIIIKGDIFLAESYQKAITYHAQGLITRLDSYDPKRWRKMTFGIPLKYFGRLSHRVSPVLVRMRFDRINRFLIRLIRSKGFGRLRRKESFNNI